MTNVAVIILLPFNAT